MNIKLSRSFKKTLRKKIEQFNFEVGVLNDKPHKFPLRAGINEDEQLKNYAGRPISRTSRKDSGKTIGEVLLENMKRLNINLLQKPFQNKDSNIMKFSQFFIKFALNNKKISEKRIINLLQAIVRNPILKQDYGPNTKATAWNKGFNRHLFDTGQMFKNIKARLIRVQK